MTVVTFAVVVTVSISTAASSHVIQGVTVSVIIAQLTVIIIIIIS